MGGGERVETNKGREGGGEEGVATHIWISCATLGAPQPIGILQAHKNRGVSTNIGEVSRKNRLASLLID